LIDLLTVFSFDPNVQAGLEDEDKRGRLRVNLNVPWSDRLARAIEDQWGREVVQVAKELFDGGADFTSDASVVRLLAQLQSDVDGVRNVLDSVTTSDDMYRLGRVDLLRAPVDVLAALPGIDRSMAFDIVDTRERLSADARLSPLWMVQEGLMSLTDFAPLADHVTMRSLVWRVRIEAGYRVLEPTEGVAGVADSVLEGLARDESEDVLLDRVVYDAVIDVSSERPRVAYLREVTMLDLAHRLREREVEVRQSEAADEYESQLLAELGLDERGELIVGDEADAGTAEEPEPSRLDRARAERRAERQAARAERTRPREQAEPASTQPEQPQVMPGDPVDRRIGRWRSGGGS
jgi:hypothetical protein